MRLGERVRQLRVEQGLNASELARRSQLPPATVTRIEQGKNSPTSVTVEKLARGLGVEPGRLYVSTTPKTPPPRTISELLDVAGVKDRELERPTDKSVPGHIGELFEGLSYEETIALARRVINARRAVKAVIERYKEDPATTSEEKRILERLDARMMPVNAIAIISASEAVEIEKARAAEEGDNTLVEEIEDEHLQLLQASV